MNYPKRGEIWIVSLEPVKGHEIGKKRPALVISNDRNNLYAETITVIPITSNTSKVYPFEVLLTKKEANLKNDSKVKCNQIRTIDKKRLLSVLGSLSPETLEKVKQALLIHLGMS
ncbi:MAG TPA: MazF family transcriptional regulator [Candidatus Atribacteria bacterium]|nr:MazF family transcriptional regulator [Candidatus Atribacteria bacterium]